MSRTSLLRRGLCSLVVLAIFLLPAVAIMQVAFNKIIFEAEGGTLGGNIGLISDASASGGRGIIFGQCPAGQTGTPPNCSTSTLQSNCVTRLAACGYPDSTNTGVPPGTVLTSFTGNYYVRTAGAVVDRMRIRGCIVIEAPNVTVKRTRVEGPCIYSIRSFATEYQGGGLIVEDVEIDCENSGGTAMVADNTIARRVNIHGCENAFSINNNYSVFDSYIHDMYFGGEAHTDGIQLSGGSNIVIKHNTILIPAPGGTSAIISHPRLNRDVTVEDNLMAGGTWTLYCPTDTSTNFRVINNRFSTIVSPKVGEFGPWTACEQAAEVRGNYYDHNLQPVPF